MWNSPISLQVPLALPAGVELCLKSLTLLCWKDKDGKLQRFRLRDKIHSHWEDIGIRLGLTLNEMDAWQQECLGKVARCCTKVFEHWLTSGGTEDYAATWEGLYRLLEDIDCATIAEDLKNIVQLLSKDSES